MGTKRHHDKWLNDTENYVVKGCFAMTELGHGSNVCISRLRLLIDLWNLPMFSIFELFDGFVVFRLKELKQLPHMIQTLENLL